MQALPIRCAGVTLVEMLTVVGIVAALAMIAVPTADPVAGFATEAVGREVANAVRFAQREAVRTGAYHTVEFDTAAQSVHLYRLKMSEPMKKYIKLPVLHPVDKGAYSLLLSNSTGRGVRIAQALFEFNGGDDANAVSFSRAGMPVSVEGVEEKDIKALKNSTVRIERGTHARVVQVAPVTGRVTF